MPFDTLRTPDYSPLVVHFTKDHDMVRKDLVRGSDPLLAYKNSPAKDRLLSILKNRTIHASPMPWLPTDDCRAVCFTECIWDSLVRLAENYSAYGVVFSKRLIFDRGGGPALYLRGDTLSAIKDRIPLELHPFLAPFDPEATLKAGVRIDFIQEREWRLTTSLTFEYADIQHVLVDSLEDASWIVREIGALQLPATKVIPMEVYRNIKEAWRID